MGNINDAVYSVDAETKEFQYVSPAFERLLGYSLDDILGGDPGGLLRPGGNAVSLGLLRFHEEASGHGSHRNVPDIRGFRGTPTLPGHRIRRICREDDHRVAVTANDQRGSFHVRCYGPDLHGPVRFSEGL